MVFKSRLRRAVGLGEALRPPVEGLTEPYVPEGLTDAEREEWETLAADPEVQSLMVVNPIGKMRHEMTDEEEREYLEHRRAAGEHPGVQRLLNLYINTLP